MGGHERVVLQSLRLRLERRMAPVQNARRRKCDSRQEIAIRILFMFHREAPTEMIIMNEALRSKLRCIKNHSSLFSKSSPPNVLIGGLVRTSPAGPAKNVRE